MQHFFEAPGFLNMSTFVDGNQTELLTSEEAASLLRCSKVKLAKDRAAKRGLPYVKFGAQVLYRRTDIDLFLSVSTIHPGPM